MNNINDIKIELIPVLTVILETKNLTEAAKKLGVTQSAVSHSLRKLRVQLGDELVIRDGNKLAPTARAEQIYPSLKRWLGELDGIIKGDSFEPTTSERTFYISTTDLVEQMYMPNIIGALKQEKAANISIRFVRWNYDTLGAQMANSHVDLAIGVRSFDMPNLMQKILYPETFVSAARSQHPIFKKPIDLESFLSYPHTMTSSGDRVKGVVDKALEKINRERRLTHTVANFSSTPYVVENSDCILTAPRRFLKLLEKRHEIKIFEPPVILPTYEVKLFWSRKNQSDPANLWIRNFLYRTFEEVVKKK